MGKYMEYGLTLEQAKRLEAFFYWSMEFNCETEKDALEMDLDYVSTCAMNVDSAAANCEESEVPKAIILLARTEAQLPENKRVPFIIVAEKYGIHLKREPENKYIVVAEYGDDAILRRISDGIYIVAHNYSPETQTWGCGDYYQANFNGLIGAIDNLTPRYTPAKTVEMMHEVMLAMNNEDAYSEWICFMPDCPCEDDFEQIAEEDFAGAMYTFCYVLRNYWEDGLYDVRDDVFDFARKFVPNIENIPRR